MNHLSYLLRSRITEKSLCGKTLVGAGFARAHLGIGEAGEVHREQLNVFIAFRLSELPWERQ